MIKSTQKSKNFKYSQLIEDDSSNKSLNIKAILGPNSWSYYNIDGKKIHFFGTDINTNYPNLTPSNLTLQNNNDSSSLREDNPVLLSPKKQLSDEYLLRTNLDSIKIPISTFEPTKISNNVSNSNSNNQFTNSKSLTNISTFENKKLENIHTIEGNRYFYRI